MSITDRIATLFKAKTHATLDRIEDPRELLDYSYDKQVEMLQAVKRALVDVATGRAGIERRAAGLRRSADRLSQQAEQAMSAGDEDLARQALTRRTAVLAHAGELQERQDELSEEERKLADATKRLQAKVETFGTRKEAVKAQYTAAAAETYINETFTGVSEDMSDAGLAALHAQDKTARLQARVSALDDLLASGALADATQPAGDEEIQARLREVTTAAAVDEELAELKERLKTTGPGPDAPGPGTPRDSS